MSYSYFEIISFDPYYKIRSPQRVLYIIHMYRAIRNGSVLFLSYHMD